MSDKYFVDANILLYAHDRSAGIKHERTRALLKNLWDPRSGVLSTQVFQESASTCGTAWPSFFAVNSPRMSAMPTIPFIDVSASLRTPE